MTLDEFKISRAVSKDLRASASFNWVFWYATLYCLQQGT